jgi:large subunit ribosomal protein L25
MLTLELKERDMAQTTYNLRSSGMIPGIVYGGEKNINFFTDYKEFVKVFKKAGEHQLIESTYGKKKFLTLIKDFQIHPVKDTFLHFDLLEVVPDKEIKTKIPIEFVGTPKGIVLGGILQEFHTHISIEVKVKNLPDKITIDISNLTIGDSIHVKDVTPPANVKFLDAPSTVLVAVSNVKAEAETTETEATQPEVIVKEKAKDKDK